MLSILDREQPIDRRAMLTVGGLGFGGLTLANLLAAKSFGSSVAKPFTTDKSVIFLLQHGGPTQFETFDPKPEMPEAIRTVGGVTQTSVAGVTFGATMSGIAKHAHRLAIVRSYATGSSGHSNRPLVSRSSLDANIGAIYSRLVGTNHPRSGMPTNVALYPNSVEPNDLGPDERFGKIGSAGKLGSSYSPFAPGGGSTLQRNMELQLSHARFDDRRRLLESLDRLQRDVDRTGAFDGVDTYRQQAFDMVLRGVAEAFDLTKEHPRTIERYDTQAYIHDNRYTDKTNGRKGRKWYQTNARTLGRQLLLARRLCEAGCGFVTIATRFVWDMHGDKNNLGVARGMEAVGQPFDHAISAFIQDCEERGLQDKILLVSTGEMGRTPRINKNGGRDHWGRLTPLLLYGGGITEGQVIGRSARDGGEPAADAVNSGHLVSTIMHTLFDIGELRIAQALPRDLVRFATSGSPIPGLH